MNDKLCLDESVECAPRIIFKANRNRNECNENLLLIVDCRKNFYFLLDSNIRIGIPLYDIQQQLRKSFNMFQVTTDVKVISKESARNAF